MNVFEEDALSVQNSALGSVIIWRFCIGYESSTRQSRKPPIPLAFLALPVTFNPIARTVLQSTQADRGLIAFAAKFATPPVRVATERIDGVRIRRGRENMLALHDRTLMFRSLSTSSLAMGIAHNLIRLNVDDATISAVSHVKSPHHEKSEIREMLRTSEKLGGMCSDLSLHDIGKILGIAF